MNNSQSVGANNNIIPILKLATPAKSSGLAKMACFVMWGASNIALGVSIANKGRFSPITASLAGNDFIPYCKLSERSLHKTKRL